MSWIEQLRPASWRGYPFQVLEDEQALGREVVEHRFPLRTGSKGEDLGGVTPRHEVEGFILGADYMARRDAFDALLNAPGIGELILPWSGRVTARLMSARKRETDAEGGIVRYRLTFMEETDAPVAEAGLDTQGQAADAVAGLHEAAHASFTAAFTTTAQPDFVASNAAAIVARLSDTFDTFTAPLKARADELATWVAAGEGLRQDVLDLVTKPGDLAAQISGLITGLGDIAATPADALTALKVLTGFGGDLEPVRPRTPSRAQEGVNQTALVAFVQQVAAAEIVRTLAASDFTAYPEAVAARDLYADLIDGVALVAADAGDGAWPAIEAARLAMVRDLTARGASLSRLVSLPVTADAPALVLAWRLYSDPAVFESRLGDLIARNAIVNPLIVQAGTVLEALSDG